LVWFDLAYLGLVWFGLVWFGLVWFGFVNHAIFVTTKYSCCTANATTDNVTMNGLTGWF
jgi:hypothetical protein